MKHGPLSMLLTLALGSAACGSDDSTPPIYEAKAYSSCTLNVQTWGCDSSGPYRLECKAYPGPCATGTCDHAKWTPVGSCQDTKCKSCVSLKDACSFSSSRTTDTCSAEGICGGSQVLMACKQDGQRYICSCGTKVQPGKTFQGPACQEETWTESMPFTAWIRCAPSKP